MIIKLNVKFKFRYLLFSVLGMGMLLMGCDASNCQLESTVTCNYGFYDSDGKAVTYGDTITVTTLLEGTRMQYTYRRLGYQAQTRYERDSSLLNAGWTETVAEVRRDTTLLNRLVGASSMKLPMMYFSTEDTLIFTYASIRSRDTLYVSHESYSNVDLPECGTHRFHHLNEVRCNTHAAIDRVEIEASEVNYEGYENIKIYFYGTAE